MRTLKVFNNKVFAGLLSEIPGEGYVSVYDDQYYNDPDTNAISLTLSKKNKVHKSSTIFPFFANMLSEGENRALQAGRFKIDPEDDFGILLHTANFDTPGAITVREYED